jgi:hypothetical protein
MSEEKELKFIRFKTMPDDLVGWVTYKDEHIIIETPLRIEIQTLFDEGRQILAMQEYLPQSIIQMREVEFSLEDVMFCTPIRKEFHEQYEYVSDFFYNNDTTKFQEHAKKRRKKIQEQTESVENVVSILEALKFKKDKPIH